MKTIARLRDFGVPSLKVRRFAGTIKGEPVNKALAILELQSSPACQALHKLLKSAIANAEHNNGQSAESLVVSNVLVDNGPMMKRIRPRARGRAFRIFKRTSHVTIELDLPRTQRRAEPETAAASKAPAMPADKAPGKPAARAGAKPAGGSKAAAPKAKTARTPGKEKD